MTQEEAIGEVIKTVDAVVQYLFGAQPLLEAGRVDPVLLTLSSAAREEQLAARAELRAVCRAFLTSGEPRDPVAAEMIVESALEYISGEERVGV